MTHTKGPWKVEVRDGDEWWFGRGNEAVIKSGRNSIVVGPGNTPEDLANAHLIAAAPELLLALGEAGVVLEALNAAGGTGIQDDIARAVGIVRAAIAKAKGRA